MDLKYNILKHPNVEFTANGDAEPYVHGFNDYVSGGLCFSLKNDAEAKEEVTEEEDFVILSNIEVEEILRDIYKEEKSNEKK